jgi:hypothetical protein
VAFIARNKLHPKNFFLPVKETLGTYFCLLVFVLSLIYAVLTLLNSHTGCCREYMWHFGLFAFISGWAYLIRLFSKFPFVGQHSIVYWTIVWTFLKLSIFGLLLLLASAIILMAVFFDPRATVSNIVVIH